MKECFVASVCSGCESMFAETFHGFSLKGSFIMDLISKLMFDQSWRDIKLPRRCLQSASRRWCGWIIHVDQRHCSSDSTLTPTLIMCSSSDRSQFSPWESTGVEASQFQENFPRVTYRTGSNYVMFGLFLQPNLCYANRLINQFSWTLQYPLRIHDQWASQSQSESDLIT